jgi:hypothetical protein
MSDAEILYLERVEANFSIGLRPSSSRNGESPRRYERLGQLAARR